MHHFKYICLLYDKYLFEKKNYFKIRMRNFEKLKRISLENIGTKQN